VVPPLFPSEHSKKKQKKTGRLFW